MDRKHAYIFSLSADTILLLLLFAVSYVISFLGKIHPLMDFIGAYDLTYIQANPSLLPDISVLYGGLAYLAVILILGFALSAFLFITSRRLLFNKLVHKNFSHVKFWTTTKIILLSIIFLLIPVAFILWVITFVAMRLTYIIPSDTIVLFAQQLIIMLVVTAFIYTTTKWMIFFFKKKTVFAYVPTFYKSLSYKEYLSVAGKITIVFTVLYLIQTLILSNIFALYQFEQVYYFITSLLYISIMRVETYVLQ